MTEKRDCSRILQTWPWKSSRQWPAAGAGGTPRVAVQIAGTYPTAGQSEQRLISCENR